MAFTASSVALYRQFNQDNKVSVSPNYSSSGNSGSSSSNGSSNNSNETNTFNSHFVTSSEIIKSKTYYMATHTYESNSQGGKMHLCVADKEATVNSSSSESITFKIVIEASDGSFEVNLEASQNTTWKDWCNSSFNHFNFQNENKQLEVASDGHIVFKS